MKRNTTHLSNDGVELLELADPEHVAARRLVSDLVQHPRRDLRAWEARETCRCRLIESTRKNTSFCRLKILTYANCKYVDALLPREVRLLHRAARRLCDVIWDAGNAVCDDDDGVGSAGAVAAAPGEHGGAHVPQSRRRVGRLIEVGQATHVREYRRFVPVGTGTWVCYSVNGEPELMCVCVARCMGGTGMVCICSDLSALFCTGNVHRHTLTYTHTCARRARFWFPENLRLLSSSLCSPETRKTLPPWFLAFEGRLPLEVELRSTTRWRNCRGTNPQQSAPPPRLADAFLLSLASSSTLGIWLSRFGPQIKSHIGPWSDRGVAPVRVELELRHDVISEQGHADLHRTGPDLEVVDHVRHELEDRGPVAALDGAGRVDEEDQVRGVTGHSCREHGKQQWKKILLA